MYIIHIHIMKLFSTRVRGVAPNHSNQASLGIAATNLLRQRIFLVSVSITHGIIVASQFRSIGVLMSACMYMYVVHTNGRFCADAMCALKQTTH